MQIPKPFTRAVFIVAAPIFVSAEANNTIVENKTLELQHSLEKLVEKGDQWRSES